MTERILSGIRATGRLHFGNFLGAVRNFVKFQTPGNTCLYFVADLHTLTTLENPAQLRDNLIEMVKDYIAAGLDPEQSIIYAQSSVPEISELSLLLGMLQPLGQLQLIPTFKEMVRKHPNNVNLGLITYPVLMAADILGPRATLVPVGEDQVPNVELARNLAERFNNRFGDDMFVVPKMMDQMIKVPGLDGSKMGKSEADNAIDINANAEQIRARYTKGVTDSKKVRANDSGEPYRCLSVYPVHKLVSSGNGCVGVEALAKIEAGCRSGFLSCVACKDILARNIAQLLGPFQEKRAALASKDDYVRDVLNDGGKRARTAIQETVGLVRERMGIIVY
ncbi:tryptophan--tRNA ligase [Patescibacteria group bacterium]|nr:tryptophan--tRNA ligase [Patescibacteria group bacterium]